MCIRYIIPILFIIVFVAATESLSAQTTASPPGYATTAPGMSPQQTQSQQYPQQQQYINTPGTIPPHTAPTAVPLTTNVQNSNQGQIVPARPVGTVPGNTPQQTPQYQNQSQPTQNTAPTAPFQLTRDEQNRLEIFLSNWERKCQGINVMECEFQKFFYDGMVASSEGTPQPTYVTYGIAKYSKPDKGYYWEQGEIQKDGPVKGLRESRMICDGKSYYIFNYREKEVVEFPLPANMKGGRNLDSPIMFIVGANPRELQERFFLRLVPHSNADYIVLEAYPKTMDDAKSFRMVQMMVYAKTYDPSGMRQFSNGSDYTTYIITNSTINPKVSFAQRFNILNIGAKDEFDSVLRTVPSDWTHRIDNELQQQATANPQPGNMGMR